jgi:SAM-dependent methyltransferase
MVEWYEKWFGEDYLAVYGHRDEADAARQADLIHTRLACKPGARLLDLCCGDGRHARVFHERGYEVTGVDLSEVLIRKARKDSPQEITFVQQDMRAITFEETFDLCVNLFTSFGYFEDPADDLAALEAVNHALREGGCLWLDFLNQAYVRAHLQESSRRDLPGGMIVEEHRRINAEKGRIEKTIILTREWETHEYQESVRLYTHAELEAMVIKAGFRILHVFGDYDGKPFEGDCPRLILAARKETV